jgi:hypothetical protein
MDSRFDYTEPLKYSLTNDDVSDQIDAVSYGYTVATDSTVNEAYLYSADHDDDGEESTHECSYCGSKVHIGTYGTIVRDCETCEKRRHFHPIEDEDDE